MIGVCSDGAFKAANPFHAASHTKWACPTGRDLAMGLWFATIRTNRILMWPQQTLFKHVKALKKFIPTNDALMTEEKMYLHNGAIWQTLPNQVIKFSSLQSGATRHDVLGSWREAVEDTASLEPCASPTHFIWICSSRDNQTRNPERETPQHNSRGLYKTFIITNWLSKWWDETEITGGSHL